MAKFKSAVTDELKKTVQKKTNIQQVHFTANGNHYFQVYKYKKDLYGRILSTTLVIKGRKDEFLTPVESTKIVESVDREDILGSETQAENPAKKITRLDGLTKKQLKEIVE